MTDKQAKNPHAVALGKLHKRKPDAEVSKDALYKRRYRAEVASGKRTIKSRKNKPLETATYKLPANHT